MRLIGLLNWYDEPCSALVTTIIGLRKASVDHVVAVDGAYLLFPEGTASSTPDQAATIHATCTELGMGCTIHTPQTTWAGNEVEKRTRMFQIANSISESGDWWLSCDADMIVTQAPEDLKAQLKQTYLEAGNCTIAEPQNPDVAAAQKNQFAWAKTGHYPIRLLFKAQDLHCHIKHCAYRTADGRYLWAPQEAGQQEPALEVPDLIVEHRDQQRTTYRKDQKTLYYQRRERFGVERSEVANATH